MQGMAAMQVVNPEIEKSNLLQLHHSERDDTDHLKNNGSCMIIESCKLNGAWNPGLATSGIHDAKQ